MATALIVDDSQSSRTALAEWLQQQGFGVVRTADSLAQAQAAIKNERFDLVLLDLELPDGNGISFIKSLEDQPDTEVVIITGHGTIDSAIEALRGGAIDYLTKPNDMSRLQIIVTKFRRTLELLLEVDSLRGELRRMGRFGSMIGSSPAMQRVYDLVARVAPTASTVTLTGETGTGKELIAGTVHQLSPRAKMPFLPINCGAVQPNLIESELFGHERGSFTGADRQHKGIFERAHGGTLLLDEITEMPIELQVKLLRVLESGVFTRIGGDKQIEVNVRVIAATNRELEKSVQEGRLREDLLYRLNVFPIRVPPLRDRADDIELLAGHFLEKLNTESGTAKRLTPAALERLRGHTWPGNVRELRNVVERAFIIASGEVIDSDSLPLEGGVAATTTKAGGSAFRFEVGLSISDAERHLILATLEHYQGDKKKAAEVLGISLKTLYNRLNSYGSRPPHPAGGRSFEPRPGLEN
jgi:DNA-binding NtrC family response regulator